MGAAAGACADTKTVKPHRPKTVMKTAFLIVQALDAIEPDPTTRDADAVPPRAGGRQPDGI